MQLYQLKNRITTLAAVLWVASLGSSFGDPITQNQVVAERNILGYSLIGQTFTAEDAQISMIGFRISNWTHNEPGGNDFRYDLLVGGGTSGPLVGSSSFTLPEGFFGYANADFSALTLTVGQQYTVLIAAPDFDWGISWNQFADDNGPIPGRLDYSGGQAIWLGEIIPNADLTFQVQPIPEPATSTLLLLTAAFLSFHFCYTKCRKHGA